MANKTERFAVRLTAEQDALIRQAAEVEGTDLTNFTVTATLAHARDVLADRRLFALDDAAWKKFLAVLERPVAAKPRLAASRCFVQRRVNTSNANSIAIGSFTRTLSPTSAATRR